MSRLSPLEGHCHCGAIAWAFSDIPKSATLCNCSVCHRYGVLWIYGWEGDTVTVSGPTKAYLRGDHEIEFHHCPTCGCLGWWRAPDEDGRRRIAVNIRLSDQDRVADLPIRRFDGRDSFEPLASDGRCLGDLWV